MSELKLTQHPEITGRLSVLEQNGLHKEQNEVKCLAAYIDEMEGQLSAMNEELMQLHREISTIRDSSLKVRCEKLIFGAEKQLRQAATAIRTVKHNCLCMARNSVDTFKAKGKAALRRAVFAMKMNEISSHTESKTEEVITETDDGHGNIVETTTTVTRTYLYITVSHKTAEEMADHFNFTTDQRQQLSELLAEENRKLWSSVLYGIYTGDDAIVTVALSQVGNIGGEPYWSWYGFGSRVEWCACFVSWCADQCGYIDTGVCPKFAGCGNGVQWFQERGQWMDGSDEPAPGMIIFFDWDNTGGSGPQDGEADHVGIVQKVEDGIIYTIEGNSGNLCRVNRYPVGQYEIMGYGVLRP